MKLFIAFLALLWGGVAHSGSLTLLGAGKAAAAAAESDGGALAFVDSGTFTASGSGGDPRTIPNPASTTSGNKLLMCFVTRSDTNAQPTTPSGWNAVISTIGGAGSWGAGTGDVRVTVYERTSDGTEGGTNVSVDWDVGTSSGAVGGQIFQFSKTNSTWVTPVAVSGADTSEGTSWSVTASSSMTMRTNDLVFVCSGTHEDGAGSTFSSHSISATDITFGSITERSDNEIAFGNKGGVNVVTVPVTTGNASARTPALTMTAGGGTPAGVTVFVRLRDQ